jgi:hypothetical protein
MSSSAAPYRMPPLERLGQRPAKKKKGWPGHRKKDLPSMPLHDAALDPRAPPEAERPARRVQRVREEQQHERQYTPRLPREPVEGHPNGLRAWPHPAQVCALGHRVEGLEQDVGPGVGLHLGAYPRVLPDVGIKLWIVAPLQKVLFVHESLRLERNTNRS